MTIPKGAEWVPLVSPVIPLVRPPPPPEFRDFTLNSLLYDPITKAVLDYSGAVGDIGNKVGLEGPRG